MDHINKIYETSVYLVPVVSFFVGLVGSLHCVGMCGGLVLSVSKTRSDVYTYQLGRLMSYLILGLVASTLGTFIMIRQIPDWLKVLPGIALGLLLIVWGIMSIRGGQFKLKLPNFLSIQINHLWGKTISNSKLGSFKPFLVGSLSVFLPCAILYSIVFAIASFNGVVLGLISMFSFWLGTVPAMVFAPELVRKLMGRFNVKRPTLMAGLAITIGITTISFRVEILINAILPYCIN